MLVAAPRFECRGRILRPVCRFRRLDWSVLGGGDYNLIGWKVVCFWGLPTTRLSVHGSSVGEASARQTSHEVEVVYDVRLAFTGGGPTWSMSISAPLRSAGSRGIEGVVNPEVAGGKGFGMVTGIAGFTNGEIPRVSSATPAL